MSVEAFELWYEYLRRAPPETWSDQVKMDFEGVLTMSFEDWFSSDSSFKLFAKYGWPMSLERLPVRAMRRPEDADKINFDTHLVLVIDLSKPISFLMPRVESKLKTNALSEIKAGRRKWEPTLAPYKFASRPDIAALKTTLLMYDTKKANPDWPNWKVGLAVQANVEVPNPILLKQRIKASDDKPEITSKKKILEQVTSRYLKNADALIANVAVGVFPSTKLTR